MALASVDPARTDTRPAPDRRHALLTAAALMAVVAAIHATVISEHLREWLPAAVFFIAVAAGQATLALLLVRSAGPITLLAAIWSSVALIGVYVWSRTSGLPFAPVHDTAEHGAGGSHVGHAVGGIGNGVPTYPGAPTPTSAEPVGLLDLTAVLLELAVIALLVSLLPARQRRWTGNAILACGVTMWVLRATTVLS